MARIKLRIDIASAINGYTSDRNERIAFKKIMASTEAKRFYAQRAIDTIIERTLDGKDKNGSSFAKYSDAYKKSLIFRIYGKSPNRVNLQLTGAMQAAIRVTDIDARSVEIGITDSVEAEKASGHIEGANNLPVRDFWGLSVKESQDILEETLKQFSDEQGRALAIAADEVLSLAINPGEGNNLELAFEEG